MVASSLCGQDHRKRRRQLWMLFSVKGRHTMSKDYKSDLETSETAGKASFGSKRIKIITKKEKKYGEQFP